MSTRCRPVAAGLVALALVAAACNDDAGDATSSSPASAPTTTGAPTDVSTVAGTDATDAPAAGR